MLQVWPPQEGAARAAIRGRGFDAPRPSRPHLVPSTPRPTTPQGHVCAYQPRLRKIDELPAKTNEAACQVEFDKALTVRELDLSIQGTVGRLVGAPPAATTTNLAVGRERGRRGASERSNTAHGT